MIKTIDFIKKWVADKSTFSYFLPDGPEGRPFDNQYYFDSVNENSDGFVIRLNPNVELAFVGDVQFRDDVCNLILFGFDRLIYKNDDSPNREYFEGEFCLSGF